MRTNMRRATARLVLAAFLAASAVPGIARAQADRPRLGFAPDRLARIDRFLQQAVDSGRIAGAVALVLRDGQVAYERSVGWSDKESGRRMTSDAIFRIASQTKALTSTAAMMLVEEGKIALGDPVSRFIPAFAHTTVASRADSGRTVMPARREITIKDLLTHTSGISYGTDAFVASQYAAKGLGPAAGRGWYTADKSERPYTRATAPTTSPARRSVRTGRVITSTDRAATSPAAQDCSPRRATTRASWR
jgi:CubicO group peptidase (beta-lactamase class C family)